jgi:hypothetical protein
MAISASARPNGLLSTPAATDDAEQLVWCHVTGMAHPFAQMETDGTRSATSPRELCLRELERSRQMLASVDS